MEQEKKRPKKDSGLSQEEKCRRLRAGWDEFVDGFLYMGEAFSYRKCCSLVKRTGEYFASLPVKGVLNSDDCRLYAAASALRFLPEGFVPAGAKEEEFMKARGKVTELFEKLESVSK